MDKEKIEQIINDPQEYNEAEEDTLRLWLT